MNLCMKLFVWNFGRIVYGMYYTCLEVWNTSFCVESLFGMVV